jgi:hypothetical protein
VWTNNTAEERLLGVSLTGIMDNKLLSGQEGHDKLAPVLEDLRSQAVEVRREPEADILMASLQFILMSYGICLPKMFCLAAVDLYGAHKL